MRLRARRQLRHGAATARSAFLRVAAVVAEVTGVPLSTVAGNCGPGTMRRREVRFARQAAVYLTVTALDVRMGALARALGRPRIRVRHAVQAAEDAREEKAVDEIYARLEAML